MNTISQLLDCSPDHPIDNFEWGVAELSSILYRGTTYDRVEVDFIAGEVRFYRNGIPTPVPTFQLLFRRSFTASIINKSSLLPSPNLYPHESSILSIEPSPNYFPSELHIHDRPDVPEQNLRQARDDDD